MEGIQAVVKAMRGHPDAAGVQEAALGALRNFAVLAEVREATDEARPPALAGPRSPGKILCFFPNLQDQSWGLPGHARARSAGVAACAPPERRGRPPWPARASPAPRAARPCSRERDAAGEMRHLCTGAGKDRSLRHPALPVLPVL